MKLKTCSKTPAVKKKRLKFQKPPRCHCRLRLNAVWNDEMEPDKARCLIYAANTMARCFEVTELETRLHQLEERLTD